MGHFWIVRWAPPVAADDPQKPLVLLPRAPRTLPGSQTGGWRWGSSKDETAATGPATATHSGDGAARPSRKADAERFLREMQVEIERGRWIDPRGAEVPLSLWADDFLGLARRLSPTTQATYRRDLSKYILPRFGAHRLGRLPAEEIENWLIEEVAAGVAPSSVHRHYRTLRRVLQVAVEKQKIPANPCDRVQPPRVPKREMVFLTWEQAVDLAEAHHERYRALILPGCRLRDALE